MHVFVVFQKKKKEREEEKKERKKGIENEGKKETWSLRISIPSSSSFASAFKTSTIPETSSFYG